MRRLLVKIHLWLGLTIGLLWALQGLTGGMLVFHREIERMSRPALATGPILSLDRIVANAAKASGGREITGLAVQDSHHDLINALYIDATGAQRAVEVGGVTGTIVGGHEMEPRLPAKGSIWMWLFTIHQTFLGGNLGMQFVGVSGLFLLSASIFGLWIAWPRGMQWADIFAASRWRKLEHKLFGYHRAVGLLIGIILVLLATSGALLSFLEPARYLADQFMESVPTDGGPTNAFPETEHLQSEQAIGPQQALTTALKVFPNTKWVRLAMPSVYSPVYTVRLYQPREARAWLGTTQVTIDPKSGTVTRVYDPVRAPFSNIVFDALYDFHNGALIGVAARIAVMLAGFALPILYLTGVWAWWRKVRSKRGRLRRPAARKSLPSGMAP